MSRRHRASCPSKNKQKKNAVERFHSVFLLVRVTGLEPARRGHQNLNLARLPIPPYPQVRLVYPFCGYLSILMICSSRVGRLRSEGICADAARAHKRVDTCGFHPLENHPFPLDSLAQTRDRRPLRNKENGSRGTVAWLPPPFRSSQITYCYTYGQLTLCRSCGEQPTCAAVRYLTLRIRRYMARKARPCGRKKLCRFLFSKRSPVSGLRQTKK